MKIIPFLFCAALLAQPAQAFEKIIAKHCAGTKVPPALAIAVAKQESGLKPLCINVEGKDYFPATREDAVKIVKEAEKGKKSYDVGLMQINSQWTRQWKMDPVRLLDPETNIRLGIRLLHEEIGRHGLNWQAVGKYHSPNPVRGMQYAGMVSRRIKGNAELKSALANPRLRGQLLMKGGFKNFGPLKPIFTGSLGQDHDQRCPIGWSNIAIQRQQWLEKARAENRRAAAAAARKHRRRR